MDLPTPLHLVMLRDMLTARLGELRAEVRAAAHDRASDERAGPREVSDRKDDAAEAVSFDIRTAELQRDVNELQAVEAALKRLDQGTYGDCLDCGEPLALQRLLVQPAAPRCSACQASAERLAALAR